MVLSLGFIVMVLIGQLMGVVFGEFLVLVAIWSWRVSWGFGVSSGNSRGCVWCVFLCLGVSC